MRKDVALFVDDFNANRGQLFGKLLNVFVAGHLRHDLIDDEIHVGISARRSRLADWTAFARFTGGAVFPVGAFSARRARRPAKAFVFCHRLQDRGGNLVGIDDRSRRRGIGFRWFGGRLCRVVTIVALTAFAVFAIRAGGRRCSPVTSCRCVPRARAQRCACY